MEIFVQNIDQITIFLKEHPWIMLAIAIWTLYWKGLALWKSSRLSHKKWFVVLLVLNTIGILEIIYIYFVADKYTVIEEEGK